MNRIYDLKKEMTGNQHLPALDDLKRPRTMKTHFSTQFLPDAICEVKPRIIYISRDVKDVATSTYHFLRTMLNEKDSNFEQFLTKFMNGEVMFTPYREHCLFYKNFTHENILHLTYESVTGDLEAAIHKVANFLGKKVSSENLHLLKQHLAFDNMKS